MHCFPLLSSNILTYIFTSYYMKCGAHLVKGPATEVTTNNFNNKKNIQ